MSKYDVVINGYASMDRIIKIATPAKVGYTSIVSNIDNSVVYFGGCCVNIAVVLAKLGLKTLPIIRVGSDYEQLGFKNFLQNSKVCTNAVTEIKEDMTPNCYLLEDEETNHITVFYPGAMHDKYTVPLKDEFFNAKLAVMTVGAKCDNLAFYEKCKKFNVPLVFGMKADFDAFPSDFLKELLLYSSVIFTNESEREEIERRFSIRSITDLFKVGNASTIITTLGKRGSIYYEKQTDGSIKSGEIRISRCFCVVDTTGSGDAYMSGFIYGYLNGYTVEDSCNLGAAVSSCIIEAMGCCTNAPTREDLMKRCKSLIK